MLLKMKWRKPHKFAYIHIFETILKKCEIICVEAAEWKMIKFITESDEYYDSC